MRVIDDLPPVKRGFWHHAGVSPCAVEIVCHHTLLGSDDSDDPPELALDRQVECYYVRYHTPEPVPPWFNGGVALSLREAVLLAERRLGPVVCWVD